jgi:hypothetical protein
MIINGNSYDNIDHIRVKELAYGERYLLEIYYPAPALAWLSEVEVSEAELARKWRAAPHLFPGYDHEAHLRRRRGA